MSAHDVVPMRQARLGPRPDPKPAPEPPLRAAIGEALRRLRTEQRRTLREVAEVAGISMQYLSEIERGRKEASSEILEAACGALGVRVADLVARTHHVLTVASHPVPQANATPHASTAPRGTLVMAA